MRRAQRRTVHGGQARARLGTQHKKSGLLGQPRPLCLKKQPVSPGAPARDPGLCGCSCEVDHTVHSNKHRLQNLLTAPPGQGAPLPWEKKDASSLRQVKPCSLDP